MIYTTLDNIRKNSPCEAGWRKLLKYLGKTGPDDAPLAYSTILDSNGLDDALWCLRAQPQHSRIWRMYAVRCARRVQHLMTDERSLRALDVAEMHVRGLATDEDLGTARAFAWGAAYEAANTVAWDAAWVAARAAARAFAWEVAKDVAREAACGAASSASNDFAWEAAWGDAQAEQTADFMSMLAAHHAMPGESCALVDWWQRVSTTCRSC